MSLEARDITVAIKGCHVVAGADLSVAPGELVGLVGPNGAGKSTLLKAVLGLRERASGEVKLDGQRWESLSPRQCARRVAYLPQERRVEWRLDVDQIVMLGRFPHRAAFGGPTPACRAAAARALEAVGAAGLRGRPFSVLSGGERTRVLLARALAVEAPILLVDEPVAALDPYHQLHVMEILRDLARSGTGVLAVIHDLTLAARFMDRLILMHEGAVAAEGAPGDILSPELMRAVYGIEVRAGGRGGDSWVLPWRRTDAGGEG